MYAVTLKDFEWASFLHSVVDGNNDAYSKAMNEIDEKFRPFSEKRLDGGDGIGKVIIDFLHKWHTQGVLNASREELTNVLKKNARELDVLRYISMFDIEDEKIKFFYELIRKIKGFGPTATAKTLHLLCPETFIMWDKNIITAFSGKKR